MISPVSSKLNPSVELMLRARLEKKGVNDTNANAAIIAKTQKLLLNFRSILDVCTYSGSLKKNNL
jgi:hypothetical protein